MSDATENTDLAAAVKRGLLFVQQAASGAKGEQVCCQQESKAAMKKPTIRVTKWLADIPVEAQCSACPSVSFRAQAHSHRPNRDEYQKSLQAQFDEHCRTAHHELERG